MRGDLKTASFTVRGSMEQSVRWKRASNAEGFASVGAWAAPALDAYLKARARAGRPLPLYWRRGRFTVHLVDGGTLEIPGAVSPPFAYYQGSAYGLNRNKPRTLVSLADGRVIATLKTARQCRELAAELAPLWLRDEVVASAVAERHRREAV